MRYVYPVSRADDLVRGAGTGAEVKLLDGETLVVEADAVCATRSPIFHIAQVSVSIDHYVAPTATDNTAQSVSEAVSHTLM